MNISDEVGQALVAIALANQQVNYVAERLEENLPGHALSILIKEIAVAEKMAFEALCISLCRVGLLDAHGPLPPPPEKRTLQ